MREGKEGRGGREEGGGKVITNTLYISSQYMSSSMIT